MAGITVSKAIANGSRAKKWPWQWDLKWQLHVLACLLYSLFHLNSYTVRQLCCGTDSILYRSFDYRPYQLYCVLRNGRKLDKQLGEANSDEPTEEFKVSDLGRIFSSKMFWIVALLCVLYYSAIFPFQRYATNYLEVTLHIEKEAAADLFRWFPILAMILTPVLGSFLDHKGKGATMLMLGSLIMIACHLSFAFLLPIYPNEWFALLIIVILGVSFSLVPAALWPSVPKIIDPVILGSAYSLIFWIQNIGLCFVPLIIGMTLKATGGYLVPMLIFAS